MPISEKCIKKLLFFVEKYREKRYTNNEKSTKEEQFMKDKTEVIKKVLKRIFAGVLIFCGV